ncbi:hypothetical protein [Aeromicrobium sp. CTD01-1L150]|uniref:hypothetical protein n=1 Tax=Aeromicrobium sp. CTD01-1L150 TaxID=3341830 RepID=UPI0035C1396C
MTWGTHAWIDESADVGGYSPGFYVLAATISDIPRSQAIRSTLRSLVFPGQHRIHWRDETPRRRHHLAGAIADLDLTHVVAIAPADASKQERARRKCLQRLLYEVHQYGVTRVWLESRQDALDHRDREMVAALHSTRAVPRSLTVDFARPLDEPMLWLPDVVAGMTTADERTGTPTWTAGLGPAYRRIRL